MSKSKRPAEDILILDLGTTTGVSFWDGRTFASSTISLKDKAGKFNKEGFLLFFKVVTKIIEQACVNKTLKEIVVEIPHCGKFLRANRILFGLLGITELIASMAGVPLIEYRPKAVKKFWTGNGNADKKAMLAESQKRGMSHLTDHNENDAVAMMYYHLHGKLGKWKS